MPDSPPKLLSLGSSYLLWRQLSHICTHDHDWQLHYLRSRVAVQGAVLASQLGSDLEAEVARELHFGPATSLERVLLDHALVVCPVLQANSAQTQ